ncbi:MAG: bifunctional metallophosphatase/5'-nucleotidase [Saprospiraceae bacterium]|nr:bifunctional metallophosphatase/5'-nucleotidase [Saprospiraceae bacterium]
MRKIYLLVFVSLFLFKCGSISRLSDGKHQTRTNELKLTILQINDFYEIAPMDEGKYGGAARIASLRKKLLAENPNTLTVLAGDFISPSLIGTLKIDGERVRGKQMIEALNALGLDLACFGNHEFDYDEASLQKRINESSFDWISSNVQRQTSNGLAPFFKELAGIKTNLPTYKILKYIGQDKQEFKVGIISPCINSNKAPWVYYSDYILSTQLEINRIKDSVDALLLLSHLNLFEDKILAEKFPEIHLIMGGHDHDHMRHQVGRVVITKADANARSAYVHRFSFNAKTRKLDLQSELVFLDQSIPLDPELNLLVNQWKAKEKKVMREMGFDPDEVLMTMLTPLDAREQTIRNKPAPFCQMICRAMSRTSEDIDFSMMNSGSVRVDDELKSKLSQYDVLRSLPYGGSVVKVKLKGKLLIQILNAGWSNVGRGGFLQWDRVERNQKGDWLLEEKYLDPEKIYTVCVTEYLIKGLEQGLEFLTPYHKEIISVEEPDSDQSNDLRRDIRLVVVDYIKKGGR